MTPDDAPALVCSAVRKDFAGRVTALDGLDLAVPQGSFFGLLGPNGAGKTTLIRSIVGLTRPDARATSRSSALPCAGETAAAARRTISATRPRTSRSTASCRCSDLLTPARALLRHDARATPASGRDEMLAAFDLTPRRAATPTISPGGMRRRLLLARALLHRPRLVILDEPTAGVDLELRHDLWAYIRALHGDGTTILLTTHYIEEAEALCERVAFIRDGRIVAEGAPDELRERFAADRLEDVYLQLVGR